MTHFVNFWLLAGIFWEFIETASSSAKDRFDRKKSSFEQRIVFSRKSELGQKSFRFSAQITGKIAKVLFE